MSKKAIVKKEAAQEIVVFTGSNDMGFAQELDADDVRIPSLLLMQANSTIAKDRDNKVVAGDFVNSVTNEIWGSIDKPLNLVVADMFKTQVITEVKGNNWISTKPWVAAMKNEEYNDVIDGVDVKKQKCFNFVCFRTLDVSGIDKGGSETAYFANPFIVKFKGASSKNAISFNSIIDNMAKMNQPPWVRSFDLVATEETNDNGSFYVYDFKMGEPTVKETQLAALSLSKVSRSARQSGTLNVIDGDESEKSVNNIPNHAPKSGPVPVERY